MIILYENSDVKEQCTSLKRAVRLFGGDHRMAVSLLSGISALNSAGCIKEIILMPSFRFHKLQGNLSGFFAIDVKSKKEKWRIMMEPLKEDGTVFVPCHIDRIAENVKIVRIREVSPHYE